MRHPGLTWKQNINKGGFYHFGQLAPGLAWKMRQEQKPQPRKRPKPKKQTTPKKQTKPQTIPKMKRPKPQRIPCSWCWSAHREGSDILRRCREEQAKMTGEIDPYKLAERLAVLQ